MDVGGRDAVEHHRGLAQRVADLAVAHDAQLAAAAGQPRGVGQEDEVIAGEIGMDGDAEEAAFAHRGDI